MNVVLNSALWEDLMPSDSGIWKNHGNLQNWSCVVQSISRPEEHSKDFKIICIFIINTVADLPD